MKRNYSYLAVAVVAGVVAVGVMHANSNLPSATEKVVLPASVPDIGHTGKVTTATSTSKVIKTHVPEAPPVSPAPSYLSAKELAKQDEMQAFYDGLLSQPSGDLFTQWQSERANPLDEPPYGAWKLQRLAEALAMKLSRAEPDDPAYILLHDMALSSGNPADVAAAGYVLGNAGSPTAISIAQNMLEQYTGMATGGELRNVGLDAAYAILRELPAARSALRPAQPPTGVTYVDGKDMYGFPPPVPAAPLPPITDALQTAWGNVPSGGQEAGINRLHLANALVKEGDVEGVGFLLQTLDTSQDPDTRQLLQGALSGVDKPEKTQLLLQWAQTKATDTDAAVVKSWFGQAALYRYDPVPGGQATTVNVIKPLAESSSFQSEAVKTAVLEGIAEQEQPSL